MYVSKDGIKAGTHWHDSLDRRSPLRRLASAFLMSVASAPYEAAWYWDALHTELGLGDDH